jgi:hypothetical protein
LGNRREFVAPDMHRVVCGNQALTVKQLRFGVIQIVMKYSCSR